MSSRLLAHGSKASLEACHVSVSFLRSNRIEERSATSTNETSKLRKCKLHEIRLHETEMK